MCYNKDRERVFLDEGITLIAVIHPYQSNNELVLSGLYIIFDSNS